MIKDKSDLRYYLNEDAKCYPKRTNSWWKKIVNCLETNPGSSQYYIYKYVRNLRYAEYHYNKSHTGGKTTHLIPLSYYYMKLKSISYKIGFQIPPNTCGPGLQIWHYGYIIINSSARIGKNVTLYPGVVIGTKIRRGKCPVIGDNCFISSGAKIFGDIKIGNNVTIAANAVVLKDIPDNAVVGGVPARIIKFKNV